MYTGGRGDDEVAWGRHVRTLTDGHLAVPALPFVTESFAVVDAAIQRFPASLIAHYLRAAAAVAAGSAAVARAETYTQYDIDQVQQRSHEGHELTS